MDGMRKMAGRLDKLFRILEIGCIVAAIAAGVSLALIAACFLFGMDPGKIGTGYDMLDIGFIELKLAEGFAPDPRSVLGIAAVDLVMAVILALLGRACMACVRRLMAPMKQGLPFHETAAGSLKRLAILSLVIGAVLNVSEVANHLLTEQVYGLATLLTGEKIAGAAMHSKLDLSCMAISGILLLLSYVFRYGQELQQLSDETL